MQTFKKKLILYACHGRWRVEKNIIIISNYLANYIKNIELITYDSKFNKYFDKRIKIINHIKSSKKKINTLNIFVCLMLLLKTFFQNKEVYIFSFQANIYCIILSILFGKK